VYQGYIDGGVLVNNPSMAALAQAMNENHVIPIMFEGSMGVASYQCRTILGKRGFHRLDPHLKKPVGLSETKKMDQLVKEAESIDIEETVAWVRTHFLA